MIDASHEGKLKAMYIIGEDMMNCRLRRESQRCRHSRRSPFLVLQDMLLYPDLPLCGRYSAGEPGCWKKKAASSARSGAFSAFTKSLNRWARAVRIGRYSARSPTSSARSGATPGPAEIMDEVASCTPMFAGVNYERLAGYKSLQWPVDKDGQGPATALHEEVSI